ncbi:type II secretion system minor pseudopilin GspK [Spongiibacter nanhainus]|uniref:Type II secretion system protein K n=1 Tax=Spongiibacter nanhainus TaxID=2794344 RepID=A0A7T4UNS3_9GAMM|nr:type II secretion system minor pseudopilin GspK [Spongiibacter nanhainus]QQD16908.1 type II secretion system minor pseudopilin GspK [Spongiibacter nanhainus]
MFRAAAYSRHQRARLAARPPSGQRGAALLMVLMMVAIMLVLSVALVDGVRYNSQRLLNQRFMDQAFWYALGGERIAAFALEDIASEAVVTLGQPWARKDIVFPIDGGSVAGLIVDQQACFNVNNLYQPDVEPGVDPPPTAAEQGFIALLENLEISPQRAEFIIGRLRDWIDEDFSPEGIYGAEDLSYTGLDYPYMPPNRPIDSITELDLFAEFEEDEAEKIKPFLCALPESDTALNVNTLTVEDAPLLAAFTGNILPVEQIEALIEARPEDGWQDIADFVSVLGLPGGQTLTGEQLQTLGVDSNYFLGLADVFYEQRQMRVYSRFVIKNGKAVAYAREYGEVF